MPLKGPGDTLNEEFITPSEIEPIPLPEPVFEEDKKTKSPWKIPINLLNMKYPQLIIPNTSKYMVLISVYS